MPLIPSIFFPLAPSTGETILDGISHSFKFGRYDLQNAITLIGILAVIIAVLATVIMLMSIRQRRKRYVPHGLIKESTQIRDLLQHAIDQRSRFEVLLSTHGGKIPAYCTAVAVTDTLLTLECISLKNFTGNIHGREITAFFRVMENRKPQFFGFTARVSAMRPSNQIWTLELELPELIERRQKRGYLRVAPPREYVLGIAVWTDPTDETGHIPKDIREWGKPVMAYIPSKLSQVSLGNISAGGVRLTVPLRTYKSAGLEFNLANRFAVLLELREIGETEQRLRFWTLCRVQNYYTDFTTQDVEIGLQFIFQAKPQEAEPTILYWTQLPEGGEIEAIGNWSMRCHLEAFREHELVALQ